MTRRSGIKIVMGLIGLVKPMLPVMLIAILMGVVGYLASIFLTILGAYALIEIIYKNTEVLQTIFILLILCGV